MNRPLPRSWVSALNVVGWLTAIGVVVILAVAVARGRADDRSDTLVEKAAWRASVEAIRQCRRRGPRPMVEWQVCEDEVLAAEWRKARP